MRKAAILTSLRIFNNVTNMKNVTRILLFLAVALLPIQAHAQFPAQGVTLTDMDGRTLTLAKEPMRIVTIDDGFVEEVFTYLGKTDRIVGIGSWSMKRDYSYTYTDKDGQPLTFAGWSTMKALHPWLNDLVCVNSPQGNVLQLEALAALKPDLVIVRVGDCTLGGGNTEALQKAFASIDALGLPMLVLRAPTLTDTPLNSMEEEARLLGALFGQEAETANLMAYLKECENFIRDRVQAADIPEEKKARLLYLGLNPDIRKQGATGNTHGLNTVESMRVENVVGAKNAFRGQGSNVQLSAEQVYALSPDALILQTSNGYHPREELLYDPAFARLQELEAIKAGRIYPLPWSPMNCAPRMTYPIDLFILAKAAYPDVFSDTSVYTFALDFYQTVYRVSPEQARTLRSHQLLNWMEGTGF